MSLINLIQLSIVGSSTINTISGSGPRGTGSGVTFMGRAFILIRKLIKIDITFGNNRLGIRVVHTAINDHFIHATKLIVLLVHNRARTKHLVTYLTNNFSRPAIRNRRLGNLFIRSNLNRKLNLLDILRLNARKLLANKSLLHILIANTVRLSLTIERKDTILTYRSTYRALIGLYTFTTGTHHNLRGGIAGPIHINTIWSNNTIVSSINDLIRRTLETNTAETERISNLYRKNKRVPSFKFLRRRRKLNTAVKSWVPCQLLTQPLLCRLNNLSYRIRISDKVGRHILNTLLH